MKKKNLILLPVLVQIQVAVVTSVMMTHVRCVFQVKKKKPVVITRVHWLKGKMPNAQRAYWQDSGSNPA